MREDLARPAPPPADFFGDSSPAVACAACLILVLAIAIIDKLTTYELHLGVLYLVPIAMVTWTAGRNWGLGLSVGTALLWLSIFGGMPQSAASWYSYREGAVLLAAFLIVVLLVARLREALRAHELSFTALETLDAPAYVLDLERGTVLVGNRQFRASFEARPAEELARHPAREAGFRLADGRPALLRVLML
ncbi:MAG: hypothetical protein ABR570_05645 [Burkholderiales bacterium]